MCDEHDEEQLSYSGSVPNLQEIEALHRSLTTEQREELLECLLVGAAHGGDSMMKILQAWIVAAAGRELIDRIDRGED